MIRGQAVQRIQFRLHVLPKRRKAPCWGQGAFLSWQQSVPGAGTAVPWGTGFGPSLWARPVTAGPGLAGRRQWRMSLGVACRAPPRVAFAYQAAANGHPMSDAGFGPGGNQEHLSSPVAVVLAVGWLSPDDTSCIIVILRVRVSNRHNFYRPQALQAHDRTVKFRLGVFSIRFAAGRRNEGRCERAAHNCAPLQLPSNSAIWRPSSRGGRNRLVRKPGGALSSPSRRAASLKRREIRSA